MCHLALSWPRKEASTWVISAAAPPPQWHWRQREGPGAGGATRQCSCQPPAAQPEPKRKAIVDVLVTIKTFLPSFPGTGGPGSSLPECREMPGATTDSQELTCYSKSVPHSGSPLGSPGRASHRHSPCWCLGQFCPLCLRAGCMQSCPRGRRMPGVPRDRASLRCGWGWH